MREIKFRAWDGETMSEPRNMWLREDHFIEWLNSFPYPDTIFMQFTGLLDKKGVEIYEGDIVKRGCAHGQVYWSDDWCGFVIDGAWGEKQPDKAIHLHVGTEVIGNIYEGLHSHE